MDSMELEMAYFERYLTDLEHVSAHFGQDIGQGGHIGLVEVVCDMDIGTEAI